MIKSYFEFLAVFIIIFLSTNVEGIQSAENKNPRFSPVAKGWSKTKVNTTICQTNAVTTDGDTQYIAFYDPDRKVNLAKRKLGTDKWEINVTQYTGNVMDRHNVISIAIDGEGYLHMSWDHHCHKLKYCRSVKPGSLEMGEMMPMTGYKEGVVTYPEFFNLPNGDLLFLYRDGGSGSGNMMLSRYDIKTEKWTLVQDGFINGQKQRNGYTNQIAIDKKGVWHISWC